MKSLTYLSALVKCGVQLLNLRKFSPYFFRAIFLLVSCGRSLGYLTLAVVYRFPLCVYIGLLVAIPVGVYAWLRFDIGWHGYWFQLAYWLRNNPDQTLHLLIVIIVTPAVVLGAVLGLQAYAYRVFTRSQWEVSPVIQPLIRTLVNERIFATTVEHLAVLRVLRSGGAIALIVAGVWVSGILFMRVFHSESVQASHGCSTATSITANTTWSTNQCLGDVTITNGATLTIAGNTSHQLSSLTLGDGSTNGFITAQGDTVNGVGVTLTVDGNVEVKSGSSISANGQGYTVGNGPGTGTGTFRGASYGGLGGNGSGTAGDTYGSLTEPDDLGSSGNGSLNGGGAIKLTIGGNLVNNGTVSADGTGAGATGGSVWLVFTSTGTWTGSGSITAKGGNASGAFGAGGGGRIAATGYSGSVPVTPTAYGGSNASVNAYNGAPGTIYLKTSSQTNGTLVIDNGGTNTPGTDRFAKTNVASLTLDELTVQGRGTYLIPSGSTVTLVSGGNLAGNSTGITQNEGTMTLSGTHTLSHTLVQRGTLSSSGATVTVASGGTLRVDAATTLGDITVQSGGDIDHSDNSTAETYKMNLTVTNLTVNSGGTINTNGLGYDATYGPGAGTGTYGAASYGGLGGNGSSASASGDTYGSLTGPDNLGSGAGSTGNGGGVIRITIGGNLVNNGTISADGSGAGASGGSVWFAFASAGSWTGSGTVTTKGGNSSGAYGSGGGGRISVTGYSGTVPSTPTAYGGAISSTNANNGAPGTVYLKTSSQTNGTLIIDNGGTNTPSTDKYAKTNVTNLTLDEITVKGRGTYAIPSGSSVALVSGGNLSGDSTGTTLNEGTVTLAGTHTLSHTFIQRGTLSSPSATITIASDGTLRVDAATTLGDITVQSGGDIDHSDNSTAETYKMNLTVGNLTVDSGGTINTNGLGYDATYGPGAGSNSQGGGGYGGMGGSGSSGTSGNTYGSAKEPSNIGSGGASTSNGGGGAIKLTISGNLTNNGTISANGGPTGTSAGGSVWIVFASTGTWTGSGSITASGANSGSTVHGSGGGGRVAVTGYSGSVPSTPTAYGGAYNSANTYSGAPGTVYLKSSSQTNGTLTIDNGGTNTPQSTAYAKSNVTDLTLDSLTVQGRGSYLIPSGSSLSIASGGSYTVTAASGTSTLINQGTLTLPSGVNLSGNSGGITESEGTVVLSGTHSLAHLFIQQGTVTAPSLVLTIASGGTLRSDVSTSIAGSTVTVASGGTLRVDAATTLGDVTVQSGGDIDHSANSTAETYKINLTVDNLTVDSGGTINTNALGYTATNGPGGSTLDGAGHGGIGGSGAFTAGGSYGEVTNPTSIGSGGQGGTGGGAMAITIVGNLVNNGVISANGNANTDGGSGGSVKVTFTGASSSWSGSGSITTNGGGQSAGGRVAITGYVTDTHSGSTTAYGAGSSGSAAGAGTVYTKSSSQTNGKLVISNNSVTPWSGGYTRTGVTSLTLDSLVIENRGVLQIPASTTLALDSNGSITHSANATIINLGTFNSTDVTHSISGTFTANGTTTFGTVTVASGGVINHSDNSTTETYKATITATSMTVASGGLIDVNGLGYDGGATDTAGSGTGAGTGATNGSLSGGGGGGHGGVGGTGGGASGAAGGASYGSTTEPVTIGSGGGGGDTSVGGAGGGAVKLTVSGDLTVAGTIRANGLNANSTTYGGGGGAGGSIWLIVGGNMNCTGGVVTANGGNGAGSTASGGGGAGGRLVRNVTGTYTACTTYTATAGTGGTGAAAGTSYIPATAPSGLAASPVTTTSITWGFADASTTETAFRLYNASNGLAGSVVSSTTAGTGTSYQISETSLSPNTAYTRYVVAYDGTANGTPSANMTVYTLANTPGAPTVNGATTSTLTVIIAINSNPVGTEFAIFNDTTDEYVQADGSLGASAAWQTYASWGGASGRSVSGLSPNTTYTFQVKARNGDNTETSLSSGASAYTLANVPGSPTLSGAEDTSVTVVIDVNSNPAATQFAVFEDTTDQYVQADGSLGASAAWQTYASWGSASGEIVTGLTPNTSYTFQVKARNGESTETSLSSSVSDYTLAAVPGVLTLSGVGSTSLTLTVSANGNSSVTNFAIYESASGTYLQADGTLGATAAWRTYTDWGASSGSSVTGLTPNTGYTFKAKARNAESAETLYSSDSNATTLAVAPTVESVEAISDTAIRVKIDPGTNPSATLFAIYNDTAGLYLQTSGTLGASAAWQTYADWGGTTGVANTGLTAATTYAYKVKARNGEGNETGMSVALSTATAVATSAETASTTDTSSNSDSSDDRADDTTSSSTASPTPSPSPSELVVATSEETPAPSVIATTTEEPIAAPEVVPVARSNAHEAVCGFVENLAARVTGQACADEATESGGTVCLALCERPISKVSTLVKSATVLPLASLVTSVVYLGVQGLSLFTNYLRRIWYYLLVLLALRKPAKHRGKVINSVTEEPINLAMVIIYDKRAGDKMLPRVITDPDGSFPCDLSPGEYVFSVFKPGYNYPTRRLENVYRGEPVTVKEDEKFTVTLYCDPMGNQPPVVVQRALAMLTGAKRLWVPFITVGVVSSLVLFVREVTLSNAYPLAVYGAAMFVTLVAMLNRKHILTVVDKVTGKRVPGAGIYLIRPSDGVGVLNAHANLEGQFMLKAPKGRYTMQVVDLSSGRITEQLVDLTTGRLEQEFIVKV